MVHAVRTIRNFWCQNLVQRDFVYVWLKTPHFKFKLNPQKIVWKQNNLQLMVLIFFLQIIQSFVTLTELAEQY